MHPAEEYLLPIISVYGPHRGLNADWAVMAWKLFDSPFGECWVTDDESSSNTVSIVIKCNDDDETIHKLWSGDPRKVRARAITLESNIMRKAIEFLADRYLHYECTYIEKCRLAELEKKEKLFDSLVSTLREISGSSVTMANENSEPDEMAESLAEIQGIVSRALKGMDMK